MNKISLYVFLILVYLGISKSFSPSERKTPFLANEKVFSGYFEGAPLSVILEDSFSTGFLIKTYHHRYLVIKAFREPSKVVVRTSKKFWDKNLKNKGMSLFRRREGSQESSTILMPPGSLFIGDLAYGNWRTTDYGSKEWKFNRTYKNFPKIFKWGKFVPNIDFYQRMKIFLADGISYYGPNGEFGLKDGEQAETSFIIEDDKKLSLKMFKDIFKKYLYYPLWNKK